MTTYRRRAVVLVKFVFSEGTDTKRRPALVISSDDYHNSRQEVIIAAITSNITRILVGDTKLDYWKEAGLQYPSLVAGIVQTIKNKMVIRELGKLSKHDFQRVEENLKKSMDF